MSTGVSEFITPVKSATDDRYYRCLTLKNDLQVILVSDPETDKSAAALDVHVGSFHDPNDLPGLAHFLEHMLFLGTEKFPDENSYSAFLNAHNGSSNAYTDSEHTNFYFDVSANHLEEALDRFSAFFTCPLFTASATDREIQAVHNEHSKNLQNDAWRTAQILRSTAKIDHPYKKFSTGNAVTLKEIPKERGIDTRKALMTFYEKYYSANIMKLAIVGKENLDILEKWAIDKFSDVKNSKIVVPTVATEPFDSAIFPKLCQIVPVKEVRSLVLLFPLPSTLIHYSTKPTELLSHLLGHEGKGSILSLLKKQGWGNSLSAGLYQSLRSFSVFYISIDLTIEGLKKENIYSIISLIFQYLELLNHLKTEDWQQIYKECATISAISFRFKSKEQPMDYVTSLAADLQQYPLDKVLSGRYLFESLDETLVKQFLSHMKFSNLRVHVTAKKEEAQLNGTDFEKEYWYATEYKQLPFSDEMTAYIAKQQQQSNSDIHIPNPNPFIAENFELKIEPFLEKAKAIKDELKTKFNNPDSISSAESASASTPSVTLGLALSSAGLSVPLSLNPSEEKLLSEVPDFPIRVPYSANHGIELYWKPDNTFLKPKANIYLKFVSPAPAFSPSFGLLSGLFTRLLEDALNEFAYDAEVAGLKYSIASLYSGVSLSIKGYNSKLPILLRAIIEKMKQFDFVDERFHLIKEQMHRQLKSWFKEQPYQQASYDESHCLETGLWHHEEKLAVIDGLKPDNVRAFHKQLVSQLRVAILVHGNMNRVDAIEVANVVNSTLNFDALFKSQIPVLRVVELLPATTYVRQRVVPNDEDENSCIVTSFQIGEDTVQNNILASLLDQISNEAFFHHLRTVEQLGYLVWSYQRRRRGVLYFSAGVQSSDRSPAYLLQRIEAFLFWLSSHLEEMASDDWNKHVASLLSKLEEKDKTLTQETNRWWFEVDSNRLDFQRTEKEIECLKTVNKAQLIQFYNKYIQINGSRANLQVHIPAKKFKANLAVESKSEEKTVNAAANPISTGNNAAGQLQPTASPAPPSDPTPTPNASPEDVSRDTAEQSDAALPPVARLADAPPSTSPVLFVEDFTEFKRGQRLYPAFI